MIVIVFENENASDIIGGAQTPYTTQLANQCAQATQDFAVRRPSLPNYIALTSGSTQGIIDNRLPSYHQIAADNIFHQAQTSGMTWRQYSSLMPSNCDKTIDPQTNPYYVVHHEPAVYYTDLVSTCAIWAEPLGTTSNGALANDLAANTLPSLAWIHGVERRL